MNVTRDDIIALSGLDEDEVAAIAEHEHIPEVAAAALGHYLVHRQGGLGEIRRMIVDDIKVALSRNDDDQAAKLFMALRHLHEDYGSEF